MIVTYMFLCIDYFMFPERLADSLRLPQVIPSIQAQVFLCFRVLLLRMSPQHATSLWPVIVSELVQVFLYIEQELSTDSEEFRYVNFFSPMLFCLWDTIASYVHVHLRYAIGIIISFKVSRDYFVFIFQNSVLSWFSKIDCKE